MKLKYNSLKINLKFPVKFGIYTVHIWGKPDHKVSSWPENPVEIQRNEILQFYENYNISLKTLSQIHGHIVLTEEEYNSPGEPEADAFFTNREALAMAVKTADCIPVLFFNKKNLLYGSIHSGWRGLDQKIVSETLKRLKNLYPESFGDFFYIVGPHIHTKDYEISGDVSSKFKPEYSIPGSSFDKKYLDMEKILKDEFKYWNISPENIMWLNENTFHSEKFFSHRSHDTGRNFNIIYFTKKELR